MIERKPPNIVPELPILRPCGGSVMFDQMLDKDKWRFDLKMLGINITIVLPATELASSFNSKAAHSKELCLRLREGEK